MSRALVRAFRDRDLADYVRRCVAQGFDLEIQGDTHARLTSPDGRHVSLSTTQFSGPATHQAITRIRRIGGPPRKP